MTIKLGKIGYLNVLPIYHPLEQDILPNDFEIISGPPAELNRRMDAGEMPISAASSIEYARNPEKYLLIPDLAIGSRGPVQSVLLLSSVPVNELNGRTILVSSETHTSAALLKVLLAEHWKIEVEFVTGDASELLHQGERPEAILAIGDEALSLRYHPGYPHREDLGEAWRSSTGLPFIFGVWLVQRDAFAKTPELIIEAARKLVAAKQWGQEHIDDLCKLAASQSTLSTEEMCSYFDGLVYDLGARQVAGLTAFYKRLAQHNLIDNMPDLHFLDI